MSLFLGNSSFQVKQYYMAGDNYNDIVVMRALAATWA